MRDSFFPSTIVWQSSKIWTTYPLLSSYPQYCCQQLDESHNMINDKRTPLKRPCLPISKGHLRLGQPATNDQKYTSFHVIIQRVGYVYACLPTVKKSQTNSWSIASEAVHAASNRHFWGEIIYWPVMSLSSWQVVGVNNSKTETPSSSNLSLTASSLMDEQYIISQFCQN